ncbi:MAG: hypothetical protein OEM82_13260 [Acidobacteriota bacterium]|nr:hypothetical protein [Acidobacteriota bacterium]MDH3528316.1 hypothetical protein [Acidobacteriota bacterium]
MRKPKFKALRPILRFREVSDAVRYHEGFARVWVRLVMKKVYNRIMYPLQGMGDRNWQNNGTKRCGCEGFVTAVEEKSKIW